VTAEAVLVIISPGSPADKEACDFGLLSAKGQWLGTGQIPVKACNRHLRDLIDVGKAQPSFIGSQELPLAQAPEGYQHFGARDKGWTKVVLCPAA
jgi:threonine dehydrogenase-like Zn-dependent dehydrogenase